MRRHVVQFSGGVGSFLAAVTVAERHGTAGATLLIADTLAEDEDLWRFSDAAAGFLGVPLTVVRDGRTPWESSVTSASWGTTGSPPAPPSSSRNSAGPG
ncbi:hypothetical protein ACIQ9Q_25045 [Streptomyces sp. NPDC094438]|uniref:hypothetical protein n=1 Tax=Streptomyces sp. NPDC094438 TaxID=3366061 RepID=UPI0037FE18D3